MKTTLVELIKRNGNPISIGFGKFCFDIADNLVKDNESSRIGCEMRGPTSVAEYHNGFEMCQFAWAIQEFDVIHERN